MTNSKYYKHPKFGFVTTAFNGEIRTPLVRFAWPSLVTPKDPPPPKEGDKPGAPRYEVTGIMDISREDSQKFIASVNQMVPEMVTLFNEGNKAIITLNPEMYFIDGNAFDKEKYPYYSGHKLVLARNAKQVKCYNKVREEIQPSEILGGMKGVMLLSPMITAHGLSFKLQGVQVVEDDGFRIGGFSKDLKSKFDDWSADASVVNPAEIAAMSDAPPALEGKDAALNLL